MLLILAFRPDVLIEVLRANPKELERPLEVSILIDKRIPIY